MTLQKITEKKQVTPEHLILNGQLNIPKDGVIQLNKDREAVRSYFINDINLKVVHFITLEEKLNFLVREKYIKAEVIEQYDIKFIKKLFKMLYDHKFRFKTFMGAYKFYSQYAMKTRDGKNILEKYEDRIAFVALATAEGDEQFAFDLATEMINQRYQPATPTMLSSGRVSGGELVSCFLLSVSDTMRDIGRSLNSTLHLSKMGGGVAISLTDIRPKGDPIKGVEGAGDGIVPVMKLYEDSLSYANQLGQRQGAGAVYLNIFHKDVIDFLATKKENADEKVRMKTLSLGLVVPDKFYELVAKGEYMYLFSPYDIKNEYGVPMSQFDITKHYQELVDNPRIHKDKVLARDLENEISKLQQESGYPYIMNVDTVNDNHYVNGKVSISNLCTEILQVQEPSELNADQSYSKLGSDISCNLGSMNVVNHMASPNFGKTVEIAIRALTSVSDNTSIEDVPTIKNGNDRYHSVGLGAMSLAGYFAKNQMEYGSPESIEFTGVYFMLMRYHALKTSNAIAKERGKKFYEFEKSGYANGEFFNDYMKTVRYKEDLSDKVSKLFEGVNIPTKEDWEQLQSDIEEYGLYNAYLLATAPTGSISYINEATASIHPVVQKIEKRSEKKLGDLFYPAPYIEDGALEYYTTAFNLDQRKVIDVYAEATKHVDQGLSMTLFTHADKGEELYEWKKDSTHKDARTTRDINMLRNYAWTKGIKTIYYVRTYSADGDQVSINECESCSV